VECRAGRVPAEFEGQLIMGTAVGRFWMAHRPAADPRFVGPEPRFLALKSDQLVEFDPGRFEIGGIAINACPVWPAHSSIGAKCEEVENPT
jgi:hypothetical protein